MTICHILYEKGENNIYLHFLVFALKTLSEKLPKKLIKTITCGGGVENGAYGMGWELDFPLLIFLYTLTFELPEYIS